MLYYNMLTQAYSIAQTKDTKGKGEGEGGGRKNCRCSLLDRRWVLLDCRCSLGAARLQNGKGKGDGCCSLLELGTPFLHLLFLLLHLLLLSFFFPLAASSKDKAGYPICQSKPNNRENPNRKVF